MRRIHWLMLAAVVMLVIFVLASGPTLAGQHPGGPDFGKDPSTSLLSMLRAFFS